MKTGITATLGLIALYGITMTILNGWNATVEQFRALWYLMLPLTIGFGIQVGLYTKLKVALRSKSMMATSATTSSVAMLACCAHHATDVLPIVGLTGASIFLVQYQKPILLASLGINATGIAVMLKALKKMNT